MNRQAVLGLAIAMLASLSCEAQQLQPRRWSHLPIATNFAGAGYGYTRADISFDPVLRIEQAKLELHTFPMKYIRTFEFAGRTARIDWLQAYQRATWTGLLDGAPASTSRNGWSDMSLRFAINLLGAPPLRAKEFKEYRASISEETLVGLGLAVHLPTGDYLEDKLLNLGTNRFTFRPQLGAVHNRGKWSTEVTASSWIYTDNDQFFDGNYLEQDPLYTIQGQVDYTFRPGLWTGGGIAFGAGGRSTINDERKNDQKENLAWAASFGYPFSKMLGIRLSYIGTESLNNVGADSNSILATMSLLW